MCRHRTISIFIVPYRPNKANGNYVRLRDTRFVEHSFFLCEKIRLIFINGLMRRFLLSYE